MKTQIKADLMLVLVTLCWGISYYLIDVCLGDMGPFTLNAHRFLGAFFVIGILFFKKMKKVNPATIKYSFFIGIALLFVYIGATFGVKYTSLSNSGFLCALTVIWVPIFELIFFRKVPQKKLILAVSLSLIGIMMLTIRGDAGLSLSHLKGDLLCIMGGAAYAIALIVTDKGVNREDVDAFQVGVFQLGFTGIFMLVLAVLLENPHFPTTPRIWASVIFLSLFCTGLAFVVQAVAQQYTSASHVGIIFTLEPVFAAVTAFLLAGERLSVLGYVGAVIMLSAMFVMETDFKNKFK